MTKAVILIEAQLHPPTGQHVLILSDVPAALGRDLFLFVRHRFTLAEVGRGGDRWEIRTTAYSYRLTDVDEHEPVVYHWDPDPASRSPVMTPHLHVGRSLAHPSLPTPFRERVGRLVKAHLPTGHVTLTAVLRAAVNDLGVVPQRADWKTRFDRAETALAASLDWQR